MAEVTRSAWEQLKYEWSTGAEKVKAAARLLGAETLGSHHYMGALAATPPRMILEGKSFGEAFGDSLSELPYGDDADAAVREAHEHAKEAGVPSWVRGAISLLAPGTAGEVKGGLAAAAALPMGIRAVRGGGRRMASRPPGRAARLSSDIMASKTQPLIEPDELVGSQLSLGSRVDIRSAKNQSEAIRLANSGRHIKRTPDGSYVGAQWLKAPEDLVRMRWHLDDLVDEGVKAGGETWYMNTQDGIRLITNGRAEELRAGRELGGTSINRTPETNFDMMLGAHNAAQVGDTPGKVFRRVGAQFQEEAAGSGRISGGPKIDPYTANITPGDKGLLPANDVWMHRALGGDGVPTQGSHTFMDAETMLAVERANDRALGGRTDWTGSEIQAAAWVAIKGREILDTRKGFTLQTALAEAAKSYPDYFPKHTFRSTMESTPGAASAHMPGVRASSFDEQRRYAEAADPWVQEWRDIAAEGAGLNLQVKGGPMVGTYQGAQAPGEFSETLVGFRTDPRRMGDSERAALEKVEAFRAVVDGQESGAGHYTMPEGLPGVKASEMQGVEALTDRALTPGEMRTFETEVGRARGGLEWVSNTGARAIAQFDGPVAKATETAIRGALEDAGIPLRALRRAKHDSIYQDFSDEWAEGGGAVTRKLLEIMSGADAPLVARRMEADPKIRQAVLSRMTRDARLAADNIPGFDPNLALQNFRKIFAESGFDGLRRALESGELLPAVFLPAIGLGVALSVAGEEEGPNL